jgi:hypothetical protein
MQRAIPVDQAGLRVLPISYEKAGDQGFRSRTIARIPAE